MNTISRRSLLQLAGVTLGAMPLSKLPIFPLDGGVQQGRALTAASIFQTRSEQAEVVGRLWPDSVVSLVDAQGDWYQLANGFVKRTDIQPMTAYSPVEQTPTFNGSFWAEVAGPVASVREYCAANAPLVTRLGHGAVLQVVDYLPGEPGGWYGLADENATFLGWTQSVFWREVNGETNTNSFGQRQLVINRRTNLLTASENGQTVLRAICSVGQEIPSGQYDLRSQQMSTSWLDGAEKRYGIPWRTGLGDSVVIAGAYWHNRFGESISGQTVQTTPMLARWLYGWLNIRTQIVVS